MLRDAGFTVEAPRRFERPQPVRGRAAGRRAGRGRPAARCARWRAGVRAVRRRGARPTPQALAARAAAFDGPVYLFGAHVFSQFLIGCGFPGRARRGVLDNDPAKQGLRLYGTPLTVSRARGGR